MPSPLPCLRIRAGKGGSCGTVSGQNSPCKNQVLHRHHLKTVAAPQSVVFGFSFTLRIYFAHSSRNKFTVILNVMPQRSLAYAWPECRSSVGWSGLLQMFAAVTGD